MPTFGRARALRLVEFLEIPWRDVGGGHSEYLPYSWGGTELLIPTERDPNSIAHEACHWLEASPERRRRQEFGLGQSPYYYNIERPPVSARIDPLRIDYHEIRTCLLQLWLYHALGGPWRALGNEYNFYPTPHRSWAVFWSGEADIADSEFLHGKHTKQLNRSAELVTLKAFVRKERRRS